MRKGSIGELMLKLVVHKPTSRFTIWLSAVNLAAARNQQPQRFIRIGSLCLPHLPRRWGSTEVDQRGDNEKDIVYQSPLASVVTRLRTVSLVTAIIGAVGLPAVVAFKGGELPSTGLLAFGMTFCAGTVGSTAAINFVFSPYVYSIERIPVRVCHFKLENEMEQNCEKRVPKDFLLKAVTKSLFLTEVHTVFDPAKDVEPYNGLRPMCSFTAKSVPLYLHSEYVHDQVLRKQLILDKELPPPPKENPDDLI